MKPLRKTAIDIDPDLPFFEKIRIHNSAQPALQPLARRVTISTRSSVSEIIMRVSSVVPEAYKIDHILFISK